MPLLDRKNFPHSLLENLRTHQPSSDGGVGSRLDLPAEELLVVHVIPVVRVAQLIRQLHRTVLLQLRNDPRDDLLPLFDRRLVLVLRRHLEDVELFVHLVEHFDTGREGAFAQIVETDIALLEIFVVAGEAVIAEEGINRMRHLQCLARCSRSAPPSNPNQPQAQSR